MESSVTAFGWLDYVVWVFYIIFMAYFGLKTSGKQQSAKDYFLGGNGLPWWAVLFSVVATETSTLTFISIPAVAYGGNLTFLQITAWQEIVSFPKLVQARNFRSSSTARRSQLLHLPLVTAL